MAEVSAFIYNVIFWRTTLGLGVKIKVRRMNALGLCPFILVPYTFGGHTLPACMPRGLSALVWRGS